MFTWLRRWFSTQRGTTRRGNGLDPQSDNPSRNSALHGATEAQSSVSPEDYPAEKRASQTGTATGRPSGTVMPPPD